MDKPFIHLFTSPKYKYLYDFNTNAILRITDNVYEDLNRYLKQGDLKFSSLESKKDIQRLLENDFLKAIRWRDIEHPATQMLSQYLKSSVETLTLQITQQCNLRCKYCPYSGTYYNRKHDNKKMSFETAKKAINFYIQHSYDQPTFNISFYGGEPLLEYQLIKKLVEYSLIAGYGKEIRFRMTTNATLLNDEIIDFLVKHDFNITISLDGPKELHDKNRTQAGDIGSFDKVIKNIELINNKYPQYVKNILFNCVIDPTGDFGCLNDFFTNVGMVKDFLTNFSKISQEGMKEDNYAPTTTYTETYNYEMFKLMLSKINKLSDEHVSKIVRSYYTHLMTTFADRNIAVNRSDIGHPGGPCIPGGHKLFVDIYGKFYPCEKLNECSNDLIIGDVDHGFDVEKSADILNIGCLTKENCKNCWCSKYCYLCVLYADDGTCISKEVKASHCPGVKSEMENLFKDYCLIKERNVYENTVFFL